jgi:hypothetical protein
MTVPKKKPTWKPVWQHVVVALGLVALLSLVGVPAYVAVALNTLWWALREAYQAWRLGKDLDPTAWSKRKKAEWIAPTTAGAVAGVVMHWAAPALRAAVLGA